MNNQLGIELLALAARLNNPNIMGELLRSLCFVQDADNELLGCYSSFELIPEFTIWNQSERKKFWREATGESSSEALEFMSKAGNGGMLECADCTIELCYFWDGDGILCFRLIDNIGPVFMFINEDCKKDYGWRNSIKTLGYFSECD